MRRAVPAIVLVLAASGICWLFPLFHIVPLKTATAEKTAATFSATEFAETFWSDKLLKSLDQAVKVDVLLPAIQKDSAAAQKKYAHSLGLSDNYIYFLRGAGKVLSISDNEISLAVTAGSTNADIVLETGLLFGNALRDGTGLLSANDYPNSQDFNDIAAALNKIAGARVLPPLREHAKVGATISFVGCAEVDDESTDLHPLHVVPIQTEMP